MQSCSVKVTIAEYDENESVENDIRSDKNHVHRSEEVHSASANHTGIIRNRSKRSSLLDKYKLTLMCPKSSEKSYFRITNINETV
jgi:hypothetical protein